MQHRAEHKPPRPRQPQRQRSQARHHLHTHDASLYYNIDLCLALGQVKNSFLPFQYGVSGFHDQEWVFYQGASPGGWHPDCGGGFYIAPVVKTLALSVSYQKSAESRLIQFGLGFRIGK